MFAIIIIILVLISFVSIISYSILSLNHNLSVNNDSMTLDNELTLIKNTLISNARAIVSSNEYALPYGEDVAESGSHRLPTGLGIPLINHKGEYFQYCPFGVDDSTTKEQAITQNDGSSYLAATTTINDVEYATHTDPAPSFDGAAEIQAIIISKIDKAELACDDIQYNSATNTFFSKLAKVVVITKAEVRNYFRLNNLSGVQEEFTLNSTNFAATMNAINNEVSNKEFILNLEENITLTSDYSITRDFNKKSNIRFNMNGYALTGNKTISFTNVNLMISGNGTSTNSAITYPIIKLTDSNASIVNSNVGPHLVFNSKVKFSNANLYSTSTQKTFKAIDSHIVFSGTNKVIVNNSLSNESIIDLNGSEMTINDSSVLAFAARNKAPLHHIELNASTVKHFGSIGLDSSNNYKADTPIIINLGSTFYLNGGDIDLLGNDYSSIHAIVVNGDLVSGGSSSSTSNIETYVLVNETGRVILN
ncbi:hypothetical protein KW496_19735 [Vibrio fluvialis]|nr:hypothetical protein [Vibrio fluvialis]